jgi:hypothetical protein
MNKWRFGFLTAAMLLTALFFVVGRTPSSRHRVAIDLGYWTVSSSDTFELESGTILAHTKTYALGPLIIFSDGGTIERTAAAFIATNSAVPRTGHATVSFTSAGSSMRTPAARSPSPASANSLAN